jgi:hypothetical protein
MAEAMKRSTYAVLFCVSNLVSLFALLWLFAGNISTEVAERLPEKHAASYTIAAFAIVLAGSWWQVVRPRGNPHRGLSMATATMMLRISKLAMIVALSRFVLPLMTTRFGMFSSKPNLSATALWWGIGYVASTVARLVRVFLKHALPSAEDVMMNDARRPVIYFRSFDKELQRAPRLRWTRLAQRFRQSQGGYYLGVRQPGDVIFSSRSRRGRAIGSERTSLDEQMLFAQAFETIGPYIALGRPNEGYRDMDLGAAKKYVSNDQWQDVVRQWLQECAAIVLEAGDSAALGWEIDQIVLLVPPQHVIVMCPYTDDEYNSFVQAHSRRFPLGLPRTRPTSRLLVFDSAWRARELPNVNHSASETLAPFFAQVGTNVRPHGLRIVPRGNLDGIKEL